MGLDRLKIGHQVKTKKTLGQSFIVPMNYELMYYRNNTESAKKFILKKTRNKTILILILPNQG